MAGRPCERTSDARCASARSFLRSAAVIGRGSSGRNRAPPSGSEARGAPPPPPPFVGGALTLRFRRRAIASA